MVTIAQRLASLAALPVLVLGAGVAAAAQPAAACEVVPKSYTVVLDGTVANQAGAAATNAAHYLGNGAWEAVLGQKMELYVSPALVPEFGNQPIYFGEIKSITYHTNKPGPQTSVDFSMNIYTAWFTGSTSSWYGYRLSAEPYFSKNLNAPSNQWNTWSTNPGTNQLTFYDTNNDGGVYGFYTQPTLQQLQSGYIDWQSYLPSAPETSIDYSSQQVKYFEFGTGTAWAGTFRGYFDAITISLWDGTSVTFDLEPNAYVPPPLQFLDVTSPSQGGNSVPQILTSLTGTVGQPFFDVLHSDGGASYSTWSLTGGSLPPGLALKASGAIIGIPTKAGTYTFTVQMTDLAMHTATKQLTITVGNP